MMKQIEKETVLEAQEFELNICEYVPDDDYFEVLSLAKCCGLHLIDYSKDYNFRTIQTTNLSWFSNVGKLQVFGTKKGVILRVETFNNGVILTSLIRSCIKKDSGVFLIETLNSSYELKEISE